MLEETPVNHCYAVKCDKCGKTTWKGCGAHVESVSLGSKRRTAASVLGDGRILDR
ncbi:hypothetical protein EDB92DRAFT_1861328 [Lactarius akahatsu]|uniref:Uncharacterized protein n=1 Tax=Lactarius akahatsu TaxID=416441 RepID=A0AAD4QAM3_9AGAM|nr:hypothetical protein EDB92DRAFT_1861328 [Lactarius akahatsu]